MNSTAAARQITAADLWSERDDYGRTCYKHNAIRGVVVTLPKRTAHLRPAGENYLVNLWNGSDPIYFAKLAAAKAFLVANAERR